MQQRCRICKKICKICQIIKHFQVYPKICKICNKYAKYVSQNLICRICTPHFADEVMPCHGGKDFRCWGSRSHIQVRPGWPAGPVASESRRSSPASLGTWSPSCMQYKYANYAKPSLTRKSVCTHHFSAPEMIIRRMPVTDRPSQRPPPGWVRPCHIESKKLDSKIDAGPASGHRPSQVISRDYVT